MSRVMVFIDGSNLYHGLKTLSPDNTRIDFYKLGSELSSIELTLELIDRCRPL